MRLPKRPLASRVLVEMHLGGVLIETRRDLVLGLLERHAVDMVDFLAHLVVAPAIGRAGKREIIAADLERGHPAPKPAGSTRSGSLGTNCLGANGGLIAFSHHHPAHVFEHDLAMLVAPGRAHVDGARFLLEFSLRPMTSDTVDSVSPRIDRLQEAAVGITEVGDSVERDVGHGLAEHHVKDEQVVEGSLG